MPYNNNKHEASKRKTDLMLICHVKIYFLSHKYHFSEEHLNAKKSCPNTLHPLQKNQDRK